MIKKTDEIKESKDLEQLLDSLQEKFGEGAIMKLGDVKHIDVPAISTGADSKRANRRRCRSSTRR